MFKNNAYHILGLDTSANQKDVLKRSREVVNRIKIDDYPEYEADVKFFNDFRTENSVKDAVQRLQAPKKKIKEYFFWFQILDEVDEEAFKFLRENNIMNAIEVWRNSSRESGTKSFFYKKNLAILYCLALFSEKNDTFTQESLLIWKDLVNSDKFWNSFSKLYKLNDEQTASQEITNEFRNSIVNHLSDIYTELHQIHRDTEIINKFQSIFSIKGEKIEKDILNPIYTAINDASEELEKMDVSEDGILDNDERKKIKELVGIIQSNLNKLIDLGLYDDSQTKIMRDRAAEALRVIVLDLHNNLSETDVALSILNIALQIVGTSGMESKVKHEIKTLEGIRKNGDIVKPVDDLMIEKEYEEAYALIKSDKEVHKDNPDLLEYYRGQEKLAISMIAIDKYKIAREKLSVYKGDFGKLEFEEAGKLIYENINLFNFNIEVINEIIGEINENVTKINMRNVDQVDEYRDSFVKQSKEAFQGQMEESIFILLIDSYLYKGLCEFFKKYRKKMGVVNNLYTIGWITVWFYGIGLIFFIAGWIYKSRD